MNLLTENYLEQMKRWPTAGRHVLAQYDEETVIVYQAYRAAIAEYAVQHGRFGGAFSFSRMSWIKPNFLWMMYRSGWASKEGQERVLAIRLLRSGFDAICQQSVISTYDPSRYVDRATWQSDVNRSDVRLQWDPDHGPSGNRLERRAVQLGLRSQVLRDYSDRWITEILDITEFVHTQKEILDRDGKDVLKTPVEMVYPAVPQLGADEPPNKLRN